MNIKQLRALGFDESHHVPFTKQYSIGCSGCAAAVINGHPSHEVGCPNYVRECAGCSTLVPGGVKYCQECRS